MADRVIDAHVHIFLPEVVADREQYRQRDAWFGSLYERPDYLLASPEDLIASMDAAGVDTSIACGFPWADPGICRAHTEWMAEARRNYPGRIEFLGIVVPHDPSAARDAERAFDLGAAGIGELNADAQGLDLLDTASISGLMGVCRERNRPIMIHTSEPVGHLYPGKGTATPARMINLLTAYPDQPVVLAHWGGGLPFYELNRAVHQVTRNVVYDSAATTYLYRDDVFQSVVNIVGADRVLFASDYAVLRQDRLLRKVRSILDSDDAPAILGNNAERVYRLSEIEEVSV